MSPGQTVSVAGRGFSDAHAGATAGDSLVTLRLKARNGKILQDGVDVTGGRINTTLKLPTDMAPGFYVMLATQTKSDGTARAGTPARYAFKVSGTAVSAAPAASPWSSAPGGPAQSASFAGDRGFNSQTLLVGGILSLTLLAAGSVLVGRRNQTMTLGA